MLVALSKVGGRCQLHISSYCEKADMNSIYMDNRQTRDGAGISMELYPLGHTTVEAIVVVTRTLVWLEARGV